MDLSFTDVPTKTLARPGGVTIAYTVLGAGPRTLILANGLGGRLYAWEPLIRALPEGYRVITWDYRGLFDSTPPERRRYLSVPHHAEDAIAILDAEGVDRAVFCGWSMGVQVSLEAAALQEERVAGLVLLNGTYGHVFNSGFQPLMRVPFAAAWMHATVEFVMDHPSVGKAIAMVAPLAIHPGAAMFWLIAGTPFANTQPLLTRYTREVFDERTFPNYLHLFQELDAHSALPHLRYVDPPALVVSGTFDWLTPAYQSRVIAARLKNAELLELKRASHFVLLERPEVVNPAVLRFLETRARW
jgi:pimeloyl-ACP methyl ester carboxylesterase